MVSIDRFLKSKPMRFISTFRQFFVLSETRKNPRQLAQDLENMTQTDSSSPLVVTWISLSKLWPRYYTDSALQMKDRWVSSMNVWFRFIYSVFPEVKMRGLFISKTEL